MGVPRAQKFPVLLALEIRKERLLLQLESERQFTEEEAQIMHLSIFQSFDFLNKTSTLFKGI